MPTSILTSSEINAVKVIPALGDISNIRYFYPANNVFQQPIDATIVYLAYPAVRSFEIKMSIEVNTLVNDYVYLYTLRGAQVNNVWYINEQYTGTMSFDSTDKLQIFRFTIQPDGRMYITTPNFDQWIKTTAQVRSMTTNAFE